MPFFDIHISQGSVATCLRHGGIFKHDFVANLPLSLSVKKKLANRLANEVMGKSLMSRFFDSQCSMLLLPCSNIFREKRYFGYAVG